MFQRKRITGIVEKNLGRGTRLGFPTANIRIKEADLEEGIYTALTEHDGSKYPSLAFIGAAATFGENEKKLEVYILDFSHNLYGQEICVKLLEKIREARKFDTEADLVEQMNRDEKAARDFFKTYGRTE
ncbi:MAG: hypothetical protein A3C85_04300 [Candidatus Doudnabacteria bacterium RIFCSPHIGHO2_02_FULL_48_21]|uniref:riboflavin kinase n=1 Tax=Candidatus Doudnabacteria bacterium RIFCSPLOWO2_02_FULL_48_13 TaxID=1817845 RepID=A0A1F5QA84_9BACT|nr:MAG: hypothetical protein A3K05_00985 [Candidatus Doudnabacteria bacterium RIFCSPHIGHO2_01_48_18]OGE78882.1 MAG: hypothetical protein A2668_00700 [Candidatus Doudnabacteria bacterium RIFCSPHIGHO2_01_FULL_48_180]OGE91873.1 MAG: hypothetical protein A3F44_04380 [Candidatus Doudnabacteria bacterium RIFCSPHIGHO2_12_FULL_47_25]OGE94110.1 MAG: hypothetical protein A3C85_04300 [Candidatus Doudnabacteria bacterium RIFCSPHIGHO2_02_FULL_48_21]OGE98184.1 MAG: hypothetical protein A3A83_03375 [Candidatu